VNRLPQHELFASERPVRSDYARELTYARRRIITVLVLVLTLSVAGYALWGRGPANPSDIPTIKAEGAYKQKPANPGGIDIPHQDVRVYDQLEGKNGAASSVEHLLPPPETPKESPHPAAPAPDAAPIPPPVTAAAPPKTDILQNTPVTKPVDTTVAKVQPPSVAPAAQVSPVTATPFPATVLKTPAASVPVKAPVVPKTEPLSIDKVIEKINSKASTNVISGAAEKSAVQLASVTNEAQARAMMEKLQQKYADELGGTKLHLSRADLGSRGIYYRIQSESLAKDEANRICSSLKKLNAGCILVGR